MTTTAAATKIEPALITRDELMELADWERKCAKAKKSVSEAEKELTFRRTALAEKVLGVKSAEELKKLPPAKVQKLQAARLEAGDWRLERGAPEFLFSKTREGRYPAWKELYIGEMGETSANEIIAETDVTYSYRVEVTAS